MILFRVFNDWRINIVVKVDYEFVRDASVYLRSFKQRKAMIRLTTVLLFTLCLPLTAIVVGCDATEEGETEELITDVPADQPVDIPDSTLRERVEAHLLIYDRNYQSGTVITAGEIRQLGTLEVFSQDVIKDLTGLEFASGLQILKLGGPHEDVDRQTLDLTPLAKLTNLRVLELERYDITDLTPLAGLTQLQELSLDSITLEEAPAPDLTPLAGLTNLTTLWISECFITDITPLAELTGIAFLILPENWIEDITPLAKLTNLYYLILSNNKIEDFTPLAGLTNLRTLHLDSTWIEDITPLAGLTKLDTLDLSGNPIPDITTLAGLTKLGVLNLSNNWRITDIAPLVNMADLTTLTLSFNQGMDVSPVLELTKLRTLTLHFEVNVDVSPLVALNNLPHLHLTIWGLGYIQDQRPLCDLKVERAESNFRPLRPQLDCDDQ